MGGIRRAADGLSIAVAALSLAGLAGAMIPTLVVPIPAMLDYLNHLARMYLLTGAPSATYAVHLRLCSDLAMDLVVPALARIVSVQIAAKVFLGACEVLVVTGAMALEWAVKRRQRLGGPGGLLVLFSLPFAWGQLNFMFGLGLAAWGVALWIALRGRRAGVRWAVHAAMVAALFVSHFFDLGIYGLTLGLYELSKLRERPQPFALARLGGFMASPLLLLAAVMAVAGDGVGQAVFHWDDFGLKLGWPLVFMNVYDPALALLSAGVVFLLVAVLVATRKLTLTRTGAWIAAGYLATYVLLPRMMFDSQYLDVRMLSAAGMILPAFMATRLGAILWRAVPAALVAGVILADNGSVAWAWVDRQTDYRQFEASFPLLERGSTVLTAMRGEADRMSDEPLFYAPTLAAPARGAFVFSLYSMRGMQPVEPRAAFQSLAVHDTHDYTPPTLSALLAATKGQPTVPAPLAHWLQTYRNLYVIGRPGPDPLPGRLTPLYAGRSFVLYRIRA